jgi:hypothetical protein
VAGDARWNKTRKLQDKCPKMVSKRKKLWHGIVAEESEKDVVSR